MSIDEPIDEPIQDETPQYVGPFRIAFFGRRCRLSLLPLERLINADVEIVGIFLPSPMDFGPKVRSLTSRHTIPLGVSHPTTDAHTIDHIALEHEIPMYGLRRPLDGELENTVIDLAPDLLVVSCFSWKIPPSVIGVARHGGVNMHPSLLPKFRGPDPLFWAYQTNTSAWGVTVHRIEESLDSGPILGRDRFEIPDGMDGDELEGLAAERGADLLVDVIDAIRSQTASEWRQDESDASYQSFPTTNDLVLQTDWTVQRALNFVRGIIPLGYAPIFETEKGRYEVRHIQAGPVGSEIEQEAWLTNDMVRVGFQDGTADIAVGGKLTED